jgi:hypothetical protein
MAVETMPVVMDWTQTKLNHKQKLMTKAELNKLPALYATDGIPVKEKKVHLHYFGGNFDFYATEFNPETGEFFGFTKIGHDGEWGYMTAKDLLSVRVAPFRLPLERDLYFDGQLPNIAV